MTTERRSCLLRDEPLVGYPVPVDQLWNGIHITNIIWTKRVVFIYLCHEFEAAGEGWVS